MRGRVREARAWALVGVLGFAVLSGCTPAAEPSATPSPVATSVSRFATDEEALTAATEVVLRYNAEFRRVGADPEADLGALGAVMSGQLLDKTVNVMETLRSEGRRLNGKGSIDSFTYEQRWTEGETERVFVYACSDVSESRVVDAFGIESVPERNRVRIPVRVGIDFVGDSALVTEDDVWSPTASC
jgi:hypothetical protein